MNPNHPAELGALLVKPAPEADLCFAEILLGKAETSRQIHTIMAVLNALSLLCSGIFLYRYGFGIQGSAAVLVTVILLCAYRLIHIGQPRLAVTTAIGGVWLVITAWGFYGLGIHSPILFAYPGLLIAAAWLLPVQENRILIGGSILALLAFAYGEKHGLVMHAIQRDEWDYLFVFSSALLSCATVNRSIRTNFVKQYLELKQLGQELQHNVQSLRRSEALVRTLNNDLKAVTENVPAMIMAVDGDGHYRYVNQRYANLLGKAEHELIGQKVHPALSEAIQKEGKTSFEFADPSGSKRVLEIDIVPNVENTDNSYYGVMRDVTDAVHAAEQLQRMANYDALTNLPNRHFIQAHLSRLLARKQHAPFNIAVLFLDLDGFKHINDTLGHSQGDRVLNDVSQRILGALRANDVIARLGGDEFIVVLDEVSLHAVSSMADRILKCMHEPFNLDAGARVHVSVSIGIACMPHHGNDVETILRNADTAMYLAKKDGRNRFAFYESYMTTAAMDRLKTQSLLTEALSKNELNLVFQPQVDIASGKLLGAEALLRWNNADLGAVSPAVFIPMAEETGLIEEMGDWVLVEACRAWRTMHDQGIVLGKLAINVSAKQLLNPGWHDRIEAVLEQFDVPHAALQIEITETALTGIEHALGHLNAIRALGLTIAIDDFGTGHSSLSRLRLLPVNTIKIDQSFVRDIGQNPESEAIIGLVIQLAEILKMNVVAEGIEEKTQADYLLSAGCSTAQGYFYSRPVSLSDFMTQWQHQAIPI